MLLVYTDSIDYFDDFALLDLDLLEAIEKETEIQFKIILNLEV